MEQFEPKRIENFNQSLPFHFDIDNSPFYDQKPLFYLVALASELLNTHEIYFVNLQDTEQNYINLGGMQHSQAIYYDIAPNEAVKLYEYHVLEDLKTVIHETLWLSTQPYYVYEINIFEQNYKAPSQIIAWQQKPIFAYPLIVRKIENPKYLPLSPRIIEYRQNWHNELITRFGKPLADGILAINDVLYRYDFFRSIYAYGMDLYDEWTGESIDMGLYLIQFERLDTIKVKKALVTVFRDWFWQNIDTHLNLSPDGIHEIIDAFKDYHKQKGRYHP